MKNLIQCESMPEQGKMEMFYHGQPYEGGSCEGRECQENRETNRLFTRSTLAKQVRVSSLGNNITRCGSSSLSEPMQYIRKGHPVFNSKQ